MQNSRKYNKIFKFQILGMLCLNCVDKYSVEGKIKLFVSDFAREDTSKIYIACHFNIILPK